LSRRFALLVNPVSAGGKALKALPAVHAELDRLGAPHRTITTRSSEHAADEAGKAATQGETVAALSGDGMLRPIATVLKGTQSALAIVPCGRGNDLARVLGIARDPVTACATIAHGVPRPLDLGEVNGRAFVGIASAGFDSEANRFANEAPAWLGGLAYAYGALRALIAWKPARFSVRLEANGPPGVQPHSQAHELLGYTVAAASSRAYGGGMLLAPNARLDDGLLDLVEVGRVSKLRFLRGTHVKLSSVRVTRAREVRLAADRPFALYADGDPIAQLPARIRALPGAVRVLVPPGGSP
jgi:YegS/Rv2252/BmrU family lipid kinase